MLLKYQSNYKLLSVLGLIMGFGFSFIFPVDNFLSRGSMVFSMLMFVTGIYFGCRSALSLDLCLTVKNNVSFVRSVLINAICMAIYIAIIDTIIFRNVLPKIFVDSAIGTPITLRYVIYFTRAFYESSMYRLFIGGVVTFIICYIFRQQNNTKIVIMAATIAQLINVIFNVVISLDVDINLIMMLWILLRFLLPGIFWSYLYYKKGFLVSEYSAATTHLFYQPVLSKALSIIW